LTGPAEMVAGDDTLRGLLMEIAADAAGQAGAIADTIQGAFAIQMEDARRHAPEHQRAAILQGLALARDSALAAAAAKAAIDVHGRQQAAITFRRAQQPPVRDRTRQTQRSSENSVVSVATRSCDTGAAVKGKTETTNDREAQGRLFRQAAKSATRRAAVPPRRASRGGQRGETGHAFRPAARASMRLLFRIPGAATEPVAPFLSTTLDWFDLWDAGMVATDEFGGHIDAYQKHLSPGL
jgi:hypothetical protein